MMNSAHIDIDLRGLATVKKQVAKVIRQSVRRNAKTIAAAVKANVSQISRTGAMQKSISVRVKNYRGTVVAIVGPRSNFQQILGIRKRGKRIGQEIVYRPSFIWHIVESGGKYVRAHHMMQDALDQTMAGVADSITVDVKNGIAQISGK
jgi:HK97 gp10 family phage protein